MDKISHILKLVEYEVNRAFLKFDSFHSPHEGLAVIWEEFDELKEKVWSNEGRSEDARDEAIQIAAMAVRYVFELIEDPR